MYINFVPHAILLFPWVCFHKDWLIPEWSCGLYILPLYQGWNHPGWPILALTCGLYSLPLYQTTQVTPCMVVEVSLVNWENLHPWMFALFNNQYKTQYFSPSHIYHVSNSCAGSQWTPDLSINTVATNPSSNITIKLPMKQVLKNKNDTTGPCLERESPVSSIWCTQTLPPSSTMVGWYLKASSLGSWDYYNLYISRSDHTPLLILLPRIWLKRPLPLSSSQETRTFQSTIPML